MTRNEKAGQTGMLKAILGGHQERAHSPKVRAAMISDHGSDTYTAGTWIKNRMGRGRAGAPTEGIRGSKIEGKIRANRKAGTTRRG